MSTEKTVNVIGAGLAGLSASITLARAGICCNLISVVPSERAQSVLAEGGINAALDTMGEHDTVEEHFADTMRGGVYLESEQTIRNLTEQAPAVVLELVRLGVPFQSENGRLILRNFGGQKKKRTAYAKSSTGKILMTALIDEARKYESAGLIRRYPHHELFRIKIEENELKAVTVRDTFTGDCLSFSGCTILCTGGLNGFFEGMTTGTTRNTGNAAALAFDAGVEFANLEFIQYHPTTVGICDKRMLISEAARGEGGRLFVLRDGEPWYFMEEKYPELGNLMPRDVISREMAFLQRDPACGDIFLDMTGLAPSVWKEKLSDLHDEIYDYLHIDAAKEPVPVRPGIHYFMGGIRVDDGHRTNVRGLLAAGEASCKYHGANRLGGNSMLGAVFGGKTAAESAVDLAGPVTVSAADDTDYAVPAPGQKQDLRDALLSGLGVIRSRPEMEAALARVEALPERGDATGMDVLRAQLGRAMLESALARRESRGAHCRTDFPETEDAFQKQTRAVVRDGEIRLRFLEADREEGEDG